MRTTTASPNARLRACPSCQNTIAKAAESCPHCGRRFTSTLTIVGTVLIGIIVALVVLAQVL